MEKLLDLLTTPSVFIGILLFCIGVVKLKIYGDQKRRKNMLESYEALKKVLGGNIDSSAKTLMLKSSYEGMYYECQYFKSGGSSADTDGWINTLQVSVRNCQCRELLILKEGSLGIGKKIGLIDKFRTLDKQFDDRFFIETLHRQYAEDFLKKQEVRQAIMRAADKGVPSFSFTNDTLIIDMKVDNPEERVDPEDLQVVIHNLQIIYDNLPPVNADFQLQTGEKTLEENNNKAVNLVLLYFAAMFAAVLINTFILKNSLEKEDLDLARNITNVLTVIGTLIMGKIAWRLSRNTLKAVNQLIFLTVLSIPAIYLFSSSIIIFLMELLILG